MGSSRTNSLPSANASLAFRKSCFTARASTFCPPPAARTPRASTRNCNIFGNWRNLYLGLKKNVTPGDTDAEALMSNSPQPAQAGPVILEAKHEGIATLVMNRPERLNALNNELAMAVNDALSRFAADEAVRVVVITGAGRAFCAEILAHSEKAARAARH